MARDDFRCRYYPRNIDDYERSTLTFTLLQHGAYTRLLDVYYRTGGDIDADVATLCRVLGAVLEEEQEAVRQVVEKKFRTRDGKLVHARCDEELRKMHELIDKKRAAGRAGGNARVANQAQGKQVLEQVYEQVQEQVPEQTLSKEDVDVDIDVDQEKNHPKETMSSPATPAVDASPPPAYSSSSNLTADGQVVLDYLNQKTGGCFKAADGTMRPILARLRGGASVEEMRRVIDHKTGEWLENPDMARYLRPKTLFSATNYPNYAGRLPVPGQRNASLTITEWMEEQVAAGRADVVQEGSALELYVQDAGIDPAWVDVAWRLFRDFHKSRSDRRTDWEEEFLRDVKSNRHHVWVSGAGGLVLSAAGVTGLRELDARAWRRAKKEAQTEVTDA